MYAIYAGGWIDPMRRRGIKHCDKCIKVHKARTRKRDHKAERAARLARAAVVVVEAIEPCRLCGDAAWQGCRDNGYYCVVCRQSRVLAIHADIDRRKYLESVAVAQEKNLP